MKNLDFALLKLECCNPHKNAPVRIAIFGIQNGAKQISKEWLINPADAPFDFTTSGITQQDLEQQPIFPLVADEILQELDKYDLVVSANEGYDVVVLQRTLQLHDIPCRTFDYVAAKNICRKLYKGISVALDVCAPAFEIDYNPVLPLSVAEAWAKVIAIVMEMSPYNSIRELCDTCKVYIGHFNNEMLDVSFCQHVDKIRVGKRDLGVEVNPDNFDERNPLFDKNVCITGQLQHCERMVARQYIELIGGHYQDGINRKTDFLIEGVQVAKNVGADGISGKKRKAMEIREQGGTIEYLTEQDFLEIIEAYHRQ